VYISPVSCTAFSLIIAMHLVSFDLRPNISVTNLSFSFYGLVVRVYVRTQKSDRSGYVLVRVVAFGIGLYCSDNLGGIIPMLPVLFRNGDTGYLLVGLELMVAFLYPSIQVYGLSCLRYRLRCVPCEAELSGK